MTRETASNIWQIIKAYGEGATIEVYSEHYGKWIEPPEPLFKEDEKYRIKPEENDEYELPEPFGEKHYRPFNNCEELVETYHNRAFIPIIAESLNQKLKMMYRPEIWVKHKEYGTENLITAFDNDNESIGGSCVFIQDMWCDMAELFEQYTFLDGSPCGVEE